MRKYLYSLVALVLIGCLFIPYTAKIEINPVTSEAFLVRRAVIGSYEYGVDYSVADQGVATSTNNRSIKDFVDAIGSTKNAIITLRHNSGGNTTTYMLTTSETITSNIVLKPENGAILSDGGGSANLNIDGPFEAGNYKCLDWTGSGTITFGDGAVTEILAGWFGDIDRTGTSDNTAALQRAINCAASSKVAQLNLGSGHIKFTKLYFYYDATDNSGWPQTAGYEGKFIMVGVGKMHSYNAENSIMVNTVLESTDSTGPALDIDGDGVSYRLNDFHIKDMSILATNTTQVVKMYVVNYMSGLNNVLLYQGGSGGGIQIEDVWATKFEDVLVRGAGKTVSTGVGLIVRNIDTGGGDNQFNNVQVEKFETNWQVGHITAGSGQYISAVNCFNCGSTLSKKGVVFGSGVKSCSWRNSHIETAQDSGNGIAMQIMNSGQVVDVIGSFFASNDYNIIVGSSVAGDNQYYNVNIESVNLQNVITTGIKIYTGIYNAKVMIKNIFMSANTDAAGTGIDLSEGWVHGLTLENIYYPIAPANVFADNILNEENANFVIDENRIVINGQNTALSEALFQIYQRSESGAYPPLYLNQDDNDVGFINFDTDITPTTNYNHVSTIPGDGSVVGPKAKIAANGWAYYGMAKIQIKGSDYWIPLFTSDPL